MNLIKPQIRVSDGHVQHIINLIESGQYKIGDRLPGQRELTEILNTSRSSVREAIRHLEAVGLVETRTGLGTYVTNVTPDSETFFLSWLQTHRDEFQKIFEVREALESKSAELAARSATPEEIEKLKFTVKNMENAVKEGMLEEMAACDIQFHALIVEISKNDLLYHIIYNIQEAVKNTRFAVLAMPGRGYKSVEEHRLICSAIEFHDHEEARLKMLEHLKNALSEVTHY